MEEFSVLRVRFTSSSDSITAPHCIFCKRHQVRKGSPETPNGRTLFSVGWPPYVFEEHVLDLFSQVGTMTAVYLQPQGGEEDVGSFQRSFIVFSTDEQVTAALALCNKKEPLTCEIKLVGMKLWAREYALAHPLISVMEVSVSERVGEYDQQEEEKEKERQKKAEADEEGWVIVARKWPFSSEAVSHRRKKKKKELKNFYRFQQRETQRQHIAELRKRFEEDKLRVAEMKAKRKFKPF